MLGHDEARRITQGILSRSAADQTEVVLLAEETSLTRFANSRIHQNVAERNTQLRVRAVSGKKVGVASTNNLSDDAIDEVTASALRVTLLQPDNPDFVSLPEPQPLPQVSGFAKATASCTPQQRAQAVSIICRLAGEERLVASGAYTTSTLHVAVANSLGVFAYAPSTLTDLTTVIMSEDSSGYASTTDFDVTAIDPEQVAREAISKAIRSRNPESIEAGEYTVVLEEHAVGTLLTYLSYLGFGALALQENRSFMAGHLGEKITGSVISIWDDGLDASGLPVPFDFEGMPKQRVDLITNGVANAVVYDSYTASRERRETTGHALPAPNTYGPLPGNLFMHTGQRTKAELLAAVDRGLLVTRFHYVNPLHPLKTVLTGMTRDGTFLIENGAISRGVKNLRFTQNILEALARVRMTSSDSKLGRSFFGGIRVPSLLIDGFTFSGVTEF
jgi:predicted Zn-dependent protease